MNTTPREAALRERLRLGQIDLLVDLYMYPQQELGRSCPIKIGWGCPFFPEKSTEVEGWDGYPLIDTEMTAGERRRVGISFLSGAHAVEALQSKSKRFYLWEGRFIGEATLAGDEQTR